MVANEQRKPSSRRDEAGANFGATMLDDLGRECMIGLTLVETEEYRLLQKVALHGYDDHFLRYVELGDRHEAALLKRRISATAV